MNVMAMQLVESSHLMDYLAGHIKSNKRKKIARGQESIKCFGCSFSLAITVKNPLERIKVTVTQYNVL